MVSPRTWLRRAKIPPLVRQIDKKTYANVMSKPIKTKASARKQAKRIKKGTHWTSDKSEHPPKSVRVIKQFGAYWLYETRRHKRRSR